MSRPHLIDADWRIAERDLTLTPAALESVFAVGNGYIGVRGTAEDGTAAHDPGVVLNGFHETWPIVYPEDAYGLARTGQTIVAPPDASMVRLAVEGGARVLRSERTLDMRRGVLLREAELAVSGGRLRLRSRRLASLADRHLVALRLELTMLEGATDLELASELVLREPDRGGDDDPRRGKGFAERVLEPVSSRAAGTRVLLEHETRHSGLRLASGTAHRYGGVPVEISSTAVPDGAETRVRARLEAGQTLQLEKFAAYHWAADGALTARVAVTLDRAVEAGFDALEDAHAAQVAAFWQRSDVVLEGPGGLQRTVRFNLFQVMQAAAMTGGLGIAAKGVTGRGYEGHYFWDTEVYVVPFLVHTNPGWAKRLLEFRCGMLGAARRRAREVGHTGALYPWRTIDGREASAWYAAGTAQYHINADIAYAMHHYNRVTGDLGFLLERGAEVLVETARLWMELGFFSERQDGRFCINSVTGPDEYTTVVDDNAYTNLMAKENLEVATRVVEWLEATDPDAHAALMRETGLRDEEVDGWPARR